MAIKVEPTKESILCPECDNLCYWTVHPPKQLRCYKCGHIVEGWPLEENKPARSKVRENVNG